MEQAQQSETAETSETHSIETSTPSDGKPSAAIAPDESPANVQSIGTEQAAGETEGVSPWKISDTIMGEGPKPDWVLKKFGHAMDQAKAYPELESKLGGMVGAPETYEVKVSKELPEGVDVDIETPGFKSMEEFARKHNMNNECFNDMINTYLGIAPPAAENPDSEEYQKQQEEYINEQTAKLGDNGPEMLVQVRQWAENNFSKAECDRLYEVADSAENVLLLNKIINMKGMSQVPGNTETSAGPSREEVAKRYIDKRYSQGTDNNFIKETNRLFDNNIARWKSEER